MASTSAKQEIRIKLLVDNSSRKVLFAEAGKDFVDFLFGLLELPLGSILALLFQNGVSGSGSLGKIYESVKNLDDDYLVSNQIREFLMRPRIADVVAPASNTLLKQFPKQESYNPNPSQHQNFSFQSPRFGRSSGFAPPPSTFSFAFATSSSPFSSASTFSSSSFGSSTTVVAAPGAPAAPAAPVVVEGYVKGVVTYMVMDDLVVKPMSNISGISILSSMKVQNLGSVEEKTVEVDLDMGLKLLKASFESSTVLTDVFLPTMPFSSYEN